MPAALAEGCGGEPTDRRAAEQAVQQAPANFYSRAFRIRVCRNCTRAIPTNRTIAPWIWPQAIQRSAISYGLDIRCWRLASGAFEE